MEDMPRIRSSGFSEALEQVAQRAAAAVIAQARLRSRSARASLLGRLSRPAGLGESFLADPVFEAARVWRRADRSLDEMAGQDLREELVAALDAAPTRRWQRSPSPDRPFVAPFEHQAEAWKSAAQGRNFMVTSGTGSGKTECFMIPMLNDLLEQSKDRRVAGVQAIILYPLNALIESQKERLGEWMAPFVGRLSYALYNRYMEQELPRLKWPGGAQVPDRKRLRDNPSSVLVTNTTMLEYLLMRAQDKPILDQSQGKLRWIVLDEAHSYVGAQAAEMALLLRRVRQAFGVAADNVRLVATSATIGEGEETREALRKFVADLGGVSTTQVDIIEGTEEEPVLPPAGPQAALEHLNTDGEALWHQLAADPRLQAMRRAMREGGLKLSDAVRGLGHDPASAEDRAKTISVLEAIAQSRDPVSGLLFAPWRLHAFHRAQGGLHACIDPQCPHKDAHLSEEGNDWPYGQIWTEPRPYCTCDAPVFELVGCGECGTSWMQATIQPIGASEVLTAMTNKTDDDEYLLEREFDDQETITARGQVVLLAVGDGPSWLRLQDGEVLSQPDPEARCIPIRLIDDHKARACCDRASTSNLIPYRFGAPFLMGNAIPSLLQALPPMTGLDSPSRGRRLLSFTDSRQGTARFSAKLQLDAERNLTRAAIYHAVQSRDADDPDRLAALRKEISALEEAAIHVPAIAAMVEAKRQELAKADGGLKPIAWTTMVNVLSQNAELAHFAGEVWRGRPYGGLKLSEDPAELARLFLLRELFRRPRTQNNVETMGLARLHFPGLIGSAASVPRELSEAGHDLQVWDDLLHASIDIVFRANLAVSLPADPVDMRHWISPKSTIGSIIEPGMPVDQRPEGKAYRPFPAAFSRQHTLVILISRLIDADLELELDREHVDAVLRAIWKRLIDSKVIEKADTAGCFRLAIHKAELTAVETAWACPETGRLLPYAPGGLSMNALKMGRQAAKVAMPRLPLTSPAGLTDDETRVIRTWLFSDETVSALRLRGQWSGFHDRVAEFSPFLRAQEHSAQIDRASLQTYEDAFRQGRINILNCSTTMEMGVDIPDVGMVVNTNVPPSPSNYRQRVGRAGRRGEPWAMAFTFCKDTPLDRKVFRDPKTLLGAEILAPKVRFDSSTLVQRHVNSLMLGIYLRDGGGTSLKTSIGTFFGATEHPDNPFQPNNIAESFRLALQGDWVANDRVAEALEQLLRGTVLESSRGVLPRCLEMFEELQSRWTSEYSQLLAAQGAVPETESVHRFYKTRAKRMRSDFMMTELARLGFTPSYGFPVDVVSFDHVGVERGSAGPSRPLEVAIRDYAPGTETVIDGLVHRSDGIRPSWGNRLDPGAIEDLRSLWTCRSCNAFGVTRTKPDLCPVCGAIPSFGEILRPAGFLGTKKPHGAYEKLDYVAPDPVRARADSGTWIALENPALGRHRIDREGHVLNTSSGTYGHGYAVCITCGKAEAQTDPEGTSLPAGLMNHFPLQAIKRTDSARADGRCPGNDQPFRIRPQVKLGSETETDVYELQLESLADTKSGRKIALSIGAALRETLAEALGIDAEEMGVSAGPSPREDGSRRMSIFLHDRKSGGAGLSVTAETMLKPLLKRAASRLDCPSHCANGCPDCILRRDMQFELINFDRRRAHELLVCEILPQFDLPAELKIFGAGTEAITEDLPQHLHRQLNSGGTKSLSILLPEDPADWEFMTWSGFPAFLRAEAVGVETSLILPEGVLFSLELSQKLDLLRISVRAQARLVENVAIEHPEGGCILAILETDKGHFAIATCRDQAKSLDSHWGSALEAPLLRGAVAALAGGSEIDPSSLAVVRGGNAARISIRRDLDGPIDRFGQTFWKQIIDQTDDAFGPHAKVAKITYNDRYLVTPLTVRLLSEVLEHCPGADGQTERLLVTCHGPDEDRDQKGFEHNWRNDDDRLGVIEALIPKIEIDLRNKRETPHERFLQVDFADEKSRTITLDQGFGAWRLATRGVRFNGDQLPHDQARALKTARLDIALQHEGKFVSSIIVDL